MADISSSLRLWSATKSYLYLIEDVKFALCGDVGSMGKFWSIKSSKMFSLFVGFYLCRPFAGALTKMRSEQTRLIIRLRSTLIFIIKGSGCFTKIANPVVVTDSIDVVNIMLRPISMHTKPSKPAGFVKHIINSDDAISLCRMLVHAPGNASNSLWPNADAPSEKTGFWIVLKKIAQTLCGKIGLSHDSVLSMIGQKPRIAINGAAASLF